MNEVIRFALGLGVGVVRLRLPGPDRDLPRHRRLELLARRDGDRGVFMQWELHRARLAVPGLGGRVAWSAFLGGLLTTGSSCGRCAGPARWSVIATLGVLIIRRGGLIRYGSTPGRSRAGCPPTDPTLWGDVGITVDRLILLGIGIRRRCSCGCSTDRASSAWPPRRCRRASARQPRRAVPQPDRMLINWALGSASPPSPGSSSSPSSPCRSRR